MRLLASYTPSIALATLVAPLFSPPIFERFDEVSPPIILSASLPDGKMLRLLVPMKVLSRLWFLAAEILILGIVATM